MSWRKSVLILISGFLVILSHPIVLFGYHLPNLGFLAFIAYVPLLLLISKESPFKQFKITFCFAFLSYLGGMYWLYPALHRFADLSSFLSLIVLLVFLILFSVFFGMIFFLSRFIEDSLHLSRFWILPLIWIAVEWCRGHWPLGGFPWGQVGYSQWDYGSLIQISDITGVYGVTAFVVWVNLAGVEILQGLLSLRPPKVDQPLAEREGSSWIKWHQGGSRLHGNDKLLGKLIFIIFLISTIFLYGKFAKEKISHEIKNSPHFRVALLQGNIPQNEKRDSAKSEEILQTYFTLTEQASLEKPNLAIWPETAYPYQIPLEALHEGNHPFYSRFASYPQNVLIGAITISRERKSKLAFYNSALLIHPENRRARLLGIYHKLHLIPYGEYIPFKNIFSFMRRTNIQVGDYSPYSDFVLLDSEEVHLGILICYEDNFSEISQGEVKKGATLLVNLSNDAWYGDSSALPQHFAFSSFRAIENRRSLVRATNTGMTASVDPLGNLRKKLPSWERGILIDEVPLLSSFTFYNQYGDVFAFSCIGISVILLTASIFFRFKAKQFF